MSNKTEQRTNRGLVTHDTRTADAIRPLLEAVRRLDASMERVATRIEDARAKSEKLTAERRPRTLRQRILGVDHDDE